MVAAGGGNVALVDLRHVAEFAARSFAEAKFQKMSVVNVDYSMTSISPGRQVLLKKGSSGP